MRKAPASRSGPQLGPQQLRSTQQHPDVAAAKQPRGETQEWVPELSLWWPVTISSWGRSLTAPALPSAPAAPCPRPWCGSTSVLVAKECEEQGHKQHLGSRGDQ